MAEKEEITAHVEFHNILIYQWFFWAAPKNLYQKMYQF